MRAPSYIITIQDKLIRISDRSSYLFAGYLRRGATFSPYRPGIGALSQRRSSFGATTCVREVFKYFIYPMGGYNWASKATAQLMRI